MELIELRKQAENNRQSSGEVINPKVFNNDNYYHIATASDAIDISLSMIKQLYQELLNAGVARECARMILPECTSTTILMTGNLRSWIHFLDLRDDERAQKEAQLVAREIKAFLTKEIPGMFGELNK
jgi:thymidylate synthase (FAD)